MRSQRLFVLVTVVASLILMATAEVAAFRVMKGVNWADTRPSEPSPFGHWDLREFPGCLIPYTVNPNCADLANEGALCVAAATTWSAVTPMVPDLFLQPAATGAAVHLQDGENILYWKGGANDWVGACVLHPWAPFPPTGVIEESDIGFNDTHYTWVDDTVTPHQLAVATLLGEPFDMTGVLAVPGPHLRVTLNGTDVRPITFYWFDFANNAAATAQEIITAMNQELGGSGPPGGPFEYTPGAEITTASEGNLITLTSWPTLAGGQKVRTIEVEVPAGVPDVLGFPPGVQPVSNMDVQTIALHELGHFLGLGDLYDPSVFGGAEVMYGIVPRIHAKRTLHFDDEDGVNFLNTPDIGDAPDPFVDWNLYPSLVHSPVFFGRWLNGVHLDAVAEGAEHIFGLAPRQPGRNYLYEWLGYDMDGECESWQVDNDLFDDGVIFIPDPPVRGAPLDIWTTISADADAEGRWHDVWVDPLYLNIWIDWNWDGDWDDFGEHVEGPLTAIPWAGAPAPPWNYWTTVVVPSDAPPELWVRVRLDWNEDCGMAPGVVDPLLAGPRYPAQFGEVEDYALFPVGPSAIQGSFYGTPTETGTVKLRWVIDALAGIEGFDVLRSTSAEGPFVRLNEEQIPSASPGAYEDVTVWPETEFWYELRAHLSDGTEDVVQGSPVRVKTGGALALRMAPPSPNPFRASTTVEFDLPSHIGSVRLAIYDAAGRLVRSLVDYPEERGRHSVSWDGTDDGGRVASAGVYFVRLEVDGRHVTQKVVRVR